MQAVLTVLGVQHTPSLHESVSGSQVPQLMLCPQLFVQVPQFFAGTWSAHQVAFGVQQVKLGVHTSPTSHPGVVQSRSPPHPSPGAFGGPPHS